MEAHITAFIPPMDVFLSGFLVEVSGSSALSDWSQFLHSPQHPGGLFDLFLHLILQNSRRNWVRSHCFVTFPQVVCLYLTFLGEKERTRSFWPTHSGLMFNRYSKWLAIVFLEVTILNGLSLDHVTVNYQLCPKWHLLPQPLEVTRVIIFILYLLRI